MVVSYDVSHHESHVPYRWFFPSVRRQSRQVKLGLIKTVVNALNNLVEKKDSQLCDVIFSNLPLLLSFFHLVHFGGQEETILSHLHHRVTELIEVLVDVDTDRLASISEQDLIHIARVASRTRQELTRNDGVLSRRFPYYMPPVRSCRHLQVALHQGLIEDIC